MLLAGGNNAGTGGAPSVGGSNADSGGTVSVGNPGTGGTPSDGGANAGTGGTPSDGGANAGTGGMPSDRDRGVLADTNEPAGLQRNSYAKLTRHRCGVSLSNELVKSAVMSNCSSLPAKIPSRKPPSRTTWF